MSLSNAFKLSLAATTLIIAGCTTVDPQPLSAQDIKGQTQTDRSEYAISRAVDSVTAPHPWPTPSSQVIKATSSTTWA
jgi:hypothetical protein